MASFSSFLLLVFASCSVSLATASSSVLTADPRCVKFEPVELTGLSEFVDVENPAPYPTTGDMSIVTSFQPSFIPITQPYFRIQDIEARAICIVTQDQVPTPSAPSCFLEFELQFCYRNVAVEVEKDLVVKDGLRRDLLDRVPVDCSKSTKGKFMATGTGPEKYAITGGTDGFFGAFGQLTNEFDLSDFPTLGLKTTIEMCFYANVSL